jgi:hypothetical protein
MQGAKGGAFSAGKTSHFIRESNGAEADGPMIGTKLTAGLQLRVGGCAVSGHLLSPIGASSRQISDRLHQLGFERA